jgi:hypothetical protein
MDFQAFHQLRSMSFDGFHAQVQPLSDLFCRAPFGNQLQDFPLAPGETS